ATSVWPVRM
ncbi:hypothetical protein EC960107_0143, partial [Escherichia coli 96.0107]